MGEVFHALEVMNRTMKLGLNANELLVAEAGFKSALARQGNPDPSMDLPGDAVELAQGFEIVATLRPRAEKLSMDELSSLAGKEVRKPRTKVDARTIKQLNKALNVTPRTAAAQGGLAGKDVVAPGG